MVYNMKDCFNDILSKYKSGEWNVEIPLIISNHSDMEETANRFGLSYHYIPVSKQTKVEREKKQLQLLSDHNIDLVVLARYMQILSDNFVSQFQNQIINIHHSFLPAFAGAKPYHQAYDRGVKIIGATAHYVTDDLDEGPIIEQDIRRVDHSTSPESMQQSGYDIESSVLLRAVRLYSERRIMLNGIKTVVFN